MEKDVHEAIEAAERNGEVIRKNVQHWIASVEGVKMEAREFLEDNRKGNKRCFKGWFPDVKARYLLSTKAMEKHKKIERLCEEQKVFDINVSLPARPLGLDSITSKDIVLFQTTKVAMEQVTDALKKDCTNFVGIHGMGGVGKTTLVKEIARKCKEEKLFDNVVMSVVSQTVNVESIQEQIADFLDLKLEEKSVLVRASRLKNRLTSVNKILVILDDVWERLELNTIGIPSGEDHKGCTVVITTRRRQVCTAMGSRDQATSIVSLDVLSKQESWELFKLQVGDIIESPTVINVAEKLVKECGGLPIALVTVGNAMRGKDLEEWKDAALELEKSNPINIEGVDENVFKCIKFSYDYLRDEEAKACFLLCCLFPDDYNIEIERLVRYGVGLNTFKRVDKIHEARRRAHLIINNLKASSLLVASEEKGCIKMHDVVRDVAKTIVLDKYFVKDDEVLKEWPNELSMDEYNGIGISLMRNEIQKYPDAWECPNLQIFLTHHYNVKQEMPEEVFKGMKKLRVLDQMHIKYSGGRRLEPSLSHLTNLRTLIIEGDRYGDMQIWGISALGELKMLTIVSFRYCWFKEPLDALRKLKNLRLVDLTFSHNCSSLFNYTGTLAEDWNFSQLEEVRVTEMVSCSVAELFKSHPRLNVLKICITDIRRIPDNFVFPYLENFHISVSAGIHSEFDVMSDYFENSLHVHNVHGMGLPNRFVTLLPGVSILSLYRLDGFRNILPNFLVCRDSFAVLKKLRVDECADLEFLINNEEVISKIPQPDCFKYLEELRLFDLPSFRGLCSNSMVLVDIPYSFIRLKVLRITSSPKMSNMGVPLNLLRRMRQLQVLNIFQCEALEYLVDLREERVEDAVEEEEGILVKLTDMTLRWLPNLEQLWKGSIGLVHLLNLKTVEIRWCDKLKVLFHWSVAQRLEQLEELTVRDCKELEEIVGRETGEEAIHKVLFPELNFLYLEGLPRLVGFYTGNLPGSQSTPKLKTVRIYGHGSVSDIAVDGKNLDTFIKDNKELLF
ncbi:disease resistance protein RPS2-like [Tripterygium wilfordii]|uniref:disease resistance protein RPS2-like n=1 Tax=Tripterygium wilfordii TaxID=458696 RepID=UPI0018F802BB|nr:disease resistance protein RPS2-like [Tripterygium wilfordii]